MQITAASIPLIAIYRWEQLSGSPSKRSAYSLGGRLLTKPEIMEYIEDHGVKEGLVASTNDILSFWTKVMNGAGQHLMSDRLKASENLAKAKGLFSERVILENSEDKSFDINIRVV
jgi:hypothetical protein